MRHSLLGDVRAAASRGIAALGDQEKSVEEAVHRAHRHRWRSSDPPQAPDFFRGGAGGHRAAHGAGAVRRTLWIPAAELDRPNISPSPRASRSEAGWRDQTTESGVGFAPLDTCREAKRARGDQGGHSADRSDPSEARRRQARASSDGSARTSPRPGERERDGVASRIMARRAPSRWECSSASAAASEGPDQEGTTRRGEGPDRRGTPREGILAQGVLSFLTASRSPATESGNIGNTLPMALTVG